MQHKDVKKGNVHIIHNFEFQDVNEMNSYMASVEDLKKVCLVNVPFGFYALKSIEPIEWKPLSTVTINLEDFEVYSKNEVNELIAQKEEIYKSDVNPTITINPKEKGELWINYESAEFFICTNNTKDQNVWKGNRGTVIEKEPTWIPPIKGSKIHEAFTKDAIKISEQEYKQFETTIRTNTIQLAGYEFYKAFDGLTTWGDGTWATSWASKTTPLPNWIEIETKERRFASSFKFMQPYNGANCITELYIQGSNDGVNYIDLAKMNPTITYNEYQTVTIQNPNFYKIYRVKITKKNTNGVGSAGMEFIY